jgi:sec-independent protein translocase protein TatB
MDFLGVGPLELLFILLIALIVLGPKDMVKAGRTMGRYLRRLITSPTWRAIQQTSREIRQMPTKLVREAGLEEDMQDLKSDMDKLGKIQADLGLGEIQEDLDQAGKEIKEAQADLSAWTTPAPPPKQPSEPDTSQPSTVEQVEGPPSAETDKA